MVIDFEKFIDNIEGVAFVADETGRILYISENAAKISGYSKDELIGSYFFEFVFEEDRSFTMEQFKKTLNRTSKKHEFRILNKANKLMWIRIITNMVLESGE